MCLSQQNKNKLIELVKKYHSEQDHLLIKLAKQWLYLDLRYLKTMLIDTIKSYIFEGHRIGSYDMMDMNQARDIYSAFMEEDLLLTSAFKEHLE